MLINIRGNLGAQVTSTIAGFAISLENKKPISTIVHNTHNYSDWLYEIAPDTINKTFVKDALILPGNIDFKQVKGTAKTDAFVDFNAKLIIKHLPEIQEVLKINNTNTEQYPGCIHYRGFDRNILGTPEVEKLIEQFPNYYLCGDELDFISKFNHPYFHNSALIDWLTIYNSRVVYGSFSAFIFSLALLDPKFKVYLISKSGVSNHMHLTDKAWAVLNYYVKNLENINWLY